MFQALLLLSQYSLFRSTLRNNSREFWFLYIQALYKHLNKCKDEEEELLAAAQGRPSNRFLRGHSHVRTLLGS